MRQAADDLSTQIGAQRACGVLGVPRSSLYRHRAQKSQIASPPKSRPLPERALSQVDPQQLTIHSDRGSPMIAKNLALLLADLGVTKSHSRPHVPDDNPYSETHFKTMKYRPDYPDRFGCLEDVRTWTQDFFGWYNFEHHHTGLGLMVSAMVHYGQATTVQQARQQVLKTAFDAHIQRGLSMGYLPHQKCLMLYGSTSRKPRSNSFFSNFLGELSQNT